MLIFDNGGVCTDKQKKWDLLASNESSHRQTNKIKILAALGVPGGRYSIFTVFIMWVYRNIRIIYINFFIQLTEYFNSRLQESFRKFSIAL